jgi:ketosteroid isomerase-like protein
MAQQADTEGAAKRKAGDEDEADVQAFLDRMAKALTAGDGRTVATMWETPALVVGDEMLMAVRAPEEVERFFSGAKAQYNKMGITDTRADIVRLTWATHRIAIVQVRWPYMDARGEEVGEETSTYTLKRNEAGDLKLCAAVMHGAAPKH